MTTASSTDRYCQRRPATSESCRQMARDVEEVATARPVTDCFAGSTAAATSTKRKVWWWLSATALLGGAIIGGWRFARAPTALEAELQAKGSSELLVYARKEQHIVLLDRFNRSVYPGDEVRFILTGVPEEYTHVLVASVDSAAKANIYFPFEGATSAPLPGPGRWEVPGSIVLDDTLGPERVFAIFSKRPLNVVEVRDALIRVGREGKNAIRDTASINLPGTIQKSFLMFKFARPKP